MATLALYLPRRRNENSKDKIVQTKLDELHRTYLETLDFDFFQGGWCEKPEFPREDYAKYTTWLRAQHRSQYTQHPFHPIDAENKSYTETINGLRKVVFIGANKIFGVLDRLEEGNDMTKPGEIELRLHDDTAVRIRHPSDPNHYRYKELYVQQPDDFLIHLRATSDYNFSGLKALGKHRDICLSESSADLGKLLGVFVNLHRDIINDN